MPRDYGPFWQPQEQIHGPYYSQMRAIRSPNLDPYLYSGREVIPKEGEGEESGGKGVQVPRAVEERYGGTTPYTSGGTTPGATPGASTAGKALSDRVSQMGLSGGGGGSMSFFETPVFGQALKTGIDVASTLISGAPSPLAAVTWTNSMMSEAGRDRLPGAGGYVQDVISIVPVIGPVISAMLGGIWGDDHPSKSWYAGAQQTGNIKGMGEQRVGALRGAGLTEQQIADWAKANDIQYLAEYAPSDPRLPQSLINDVRTTGGQAIADWANRTRNFDVIRNAAIAGDAGFPGGTKIQIAGLYTPSEQKTLEDWVGGQWGIPGPPEMPWFNPVEGRAYPSAEGYLEGWSPDISAMDEPNELFKKVELGLMLNPPWAGGGA